MRAALSPRASRLRLTLGRQTRCPSYAAPAGAGGDGRGGASALRVDCRRLTAAYLPVGPASVARRPSPALGSPRLQGLALPHMLTAVPGSIAQGRFEAGATAKAGDSRRHGPVPAADAADQPARRATQEWQRGIADSGRRDPRHPTPTPL